MLTKSWRDYAERPLLWVGAVLLFKIDGLRVHGKSEGLIIGLVTVMIEPIRRSQPRSPLAALGSTARTASFLNALGLSLETAFARAVYMMYLVSKVHPFSDGNGRIARIMTNAELVAGNEERILVPTAYRANYLSALRALSKTQNPEHSIRMLDFAQRWAAAPWSDLESTCVALDRSHAFMDANEAENVGIRLRLSQASV